MTTLSNKNVHDWKKEVHLPPDISCLSFDNVEVEVELMFNGSAKCQYIIRVFGYQMTTDHLSIVMEFASRGDLYYRYLFLLGNANQRRFLLICRENLLHYKKDELPLSRRVRMARHVPFPLPPFFSYHDVIKLNIIGGLGGPSRCLSPFYQCCPQRREELELPRMDTLFALLHNVTS